MIAPVAAKTLAWETVLIDGSERLRFGRRLFRWLPHDPRCRMCRAPFAGSGGRVLGLFGRRPSRKSPNLCEPCFEALPDGGIELDVGILFADVRGSTTLGEQATATEFASTLNRFYASATKVLVEHDAIIDKLIGDEVMAIFLPGLAGGAYRRRAAEAAIALARAAHDLPIGVAANAGTAFVGKVGTGPVIDFTALGDAVNVASRLQSYAQDGQVVLAADLYELVRADHPSGSATRIEVKGREEPIDVVVVSA